MDQHSSLVAEILKIPEAQGAIAEALAEEIVILTGQLRNAAAAGDAIKAAWIEGHLHALEDVLGILARFAEKAKSHKEQ